jgi:thioredoxin
MTHLFLQAITAAGQGAVAALETQNFLDLIGAKELFSKNRTHASSSVKLASGTAGAEESDTDKTTKSCIRKIKDAEELDHLVNDSEKPVIVDFSSKLCIPCQEMAPIFESVAEKFSRRINFAKVDMSEVSGVSDKYKIQSAPTFVFLKDGKEHKRVLGTVPEEKFIELVNKFLY